MWENISEKCLTSQDQRTHWAQALSDTQMKFRETQAAVCVCVYARVCSAQDDIIKLCEWNARASGLPTDHSYARIQRSHTPTTTLLVKCGKLALCCSEFVLYSFSFCFNELFTRHFTHSYVYFSSLARIRRLCLLFTLDFATSQSKLRAFTFSAPMSIRHYDK